MSCALKSILNLITHFQADSLSISSEAVTARDKTLWKRDLIAVLSIHPACTPWWFADYCPAASITKFPFPLSVDHGTRHSVLFSTWLPLVSSLAGCTVVSIASKHGPQALLGWSDFWEWLLLHSKCWMPCQTLILCLFPLTGVDFPDCSVVSLACDQSWSPLWFHFLFLNSRQPPPPPPAKTYRVRFYFSVG